MADLISRLKLESGEFDSKIARAAKGLLTMEKECRAVGGTLAILDKDQKEYIKSLGQMETVSQDARGKIGELTKAFTELSLQYKRLTDEEKQGDFGTALSGSLEELKTRIRDGRAELEAIEQSVSQIGGSFDKLAQEVGIPAEELQKFIGRSESAKQKFREYSDTIITLTQAYRGLSEEEKNSESGQKMAAHIDELKAKAADLKDAISDTNEELKHMSSDTSFTDGVNLMTRTVGSCAAAIAAWTGDSKEMEVVIKDLAKIGTTVAAVDALTKAFQKQNLVLLKNPYVAATAAAIALGAALVKLNTYLNKETEEEEKAAKAREAASRAQESYRKSVSDSAAKLMTTYQRLREEWSRLTTDQQKNDWINNNKSAFDQLGLSISKIADAENAFVNNTQNMVKAFQLRAEASAFESMANDAYAKFVLKREDVKARSVKAGDEVPRGKVVNYREDEGLYQYNPTTGGYRYTEKGAREYNTNLVKESGLLDLKHEAEKYVNAQVNLLSKAENLLGGGKGTTPTITTTTAKASGKSTGSEFAVFGSLGDWEQQAASVREYMKAATSTEEYKELEQELDFIIEKMNELKGVTEITFTPGSLNDLNNQLKEAQAELANMSPEAEGWADALENVRQKMAAVAALQGQINGTGEEGVQTAKSTTTAWQAAASALATAGAAIQQIDDPAAKIAGILATAVANIALGFASASAKTGGVAGVFGWIAATTAGLATMISTITAIKSVTASAKGYSEGGMVEGSSYSGDNIVARLNAGEGVLTARGVENAASMEAMAANPFGNLQLSTKLTGTELLILLNNTNRSLGGSRSFYSERH